MYRVGQNESAKSAALPQWNFITTEPISRLFLLFPELKSKSYSPNLDCWASAVAASKGSTEIEFVRGETGVVKGN